MPCDPTDDDDTPDEGRYPDPMSVPVGLDANALDRNGRRDAAIDRFVDIVRSHRLTIIVGEAVRAELVQAGPKGDVNTTPAILLATPRSGRRSLTAAQHIARIRVRAILCGNARPGKHDADALHLSEAAEAGCGYFVTYDSRVLRKRVDIEAIALPGLKIVTLEEFLALFARPDRAGWKPGNET